MIPAYDLETQQELLTDPNSYLASTPLSVVHQFMSPQMSRHMTSVTSQELEDPVVFRIKKARRKPSQVCMGGNMKFYQVIRLSD